MAKMDQVMTTFDNLKATVDHLNELFQTEPQQARVLAGQSTIPNQNWNSMQADVNSVNNALIALSQSSTHALQQQNADELNESIQNLRSHFGRTWWQFGAINSAGRIGYLSVPIVPELVIE